MRIALGVECPGVGQLAPLSREVHDPVQSVTRLPPRPAALGDGLARSLALSPSLSHGKGAYNGGGGPGGGR